MRATSRIASRKVAGAGSLFFFSVGVQNLQFDIREHDIGRQLGSVATQQGHKHNAPGDNKIDSNRPPDALGGLVTDLLDAAAGFENAVEVLNPPSETVPA